MHPRFANAVIPLVMHMSMNPEFRLPALNAMLLIGTKASRYGAPGESGVLAFVAGRVMRNDHGRPVMRVMSELAIQPGDAVLMHLENGFRGDAAGMAIKDHLKI